MHWQSRGQLRNGAAMMCIAAAQFCLAIIRRGMVMRVQAVYDGAEQRLGIVSDRVVFRWHGILMQWESAAMRIKEQFCSENSCMDLAMRRPSEHGNCTGRMALAVRGLVLRCTVKRRNGYEKSCYDALRLCREMMCMGRASLGCEKRRQ